MLLSMFHMFIYIFLAVFVCNLSVNCGKERVYKRAEQAEIRQSRCCMREEINKGNFGENTRGMDLTHFSLHSIFILCQCIPKIWCRNGLCFTFTPLSSCAYL